MTAIKHMMLRRTFFVVFLFLFCVTLSYATKGARGDDEKQNKKNTLFGGQETKIFISRDGVEIEMNLKIDSFSSPALIEYDGMVAVVAEVHYRNKNENKEYVGVVLVNLRKNGQLGKISAVLRDSMKDNISYMLSPTVVADNTEITAFFGGYCQNDQPLKTDYSSSDCSWEPRMLTTTVRHESPESKKYLKWQGDTLKATDIFENNFKTSFESYLASQSIKEFIGSGGAGIMTNSKRYVLPVQALKDGSVVSLIITSLTSTVEDWKFSKGTSDIDCTNPAVLELENENLLMITSCKSGHYKVYEFNNEREEWTAVKTLSGVWGTNKARKGTGFRGGFIKAEIAKTNVVFFTQPVEDTDGSNIYSLHLWMTDMRHIYDVGQISANDENVSASSLLYKKNEFEDVNGDGGKLYCAYEVKNGGDKFDIVVADLENELGKIKKTLETWKIVNDKVANRFCSSSDESDESNTNCKNSVTNGLVGFLADKSENNEWKDEYLCVNATLSQGVESVADGFKFAGTEKGAKWPANSDGQNQPYYFATNVFTLVATVIIHTKHTDTVPLLGVVFKNSGEEKRYGLSCTSDYKWSVTNVNKQTSHDNKWDTETPYQVTISIEDTEFFVYINDKLIYKEVTDSTLEINDAGISSYFYFGAHDKVVSTSVTIKDVLLYNRVLSDDEIETLKERRISVEAKPEDRKSTHELHDSQLAAPATVINQPVAPEHATSQATSQSSSKEVKKIVVAGSKDSEKEHQPHEEIKADLNPTPAKEPEIDLEVNDVVTHHSDASQELNEVDSPTEPADAARRPHGMERQIDGVLTTHDISGENAVPVGDEEKDKNKIGDENTSNSEPNKVTKEEEKPADTTPTVQAMEEKEEDTTTPNATVPEAVSSSESSAADNTLLRGTTNASNHNDTLRTLLEMTKGGDGAVRSFVSLLALLPSLCLWCFLTAPHCCQAIPA